MTASRDRFDTLVKHFAAALGARGIRVNAVAPGVDGAGELSDLGSPDLQRDPEGGKVPARDRTLELGRQSRRRPGAVGWKPRKRGVLLSFRLYRAYSARRK